MDNLDLLKSDIPQTPSTDDQGISDVLKSFAVSLGYTLKDFDEESLEKGWNAWMDYRTKKIFINPFMALDKVTLAEILAHEIAHHFQFVLNDQPFIYKKDEKIMEQMAEAAATLFLLDYGVNIVESGRNYIKHHTPTHKEPIIMTNTTSSSVWGNIRYSTTFENVKGFYDGALDKQVAILYSLFKSEFECFLRNED